MRALLWGLIAVTVAAIVYDATATDHTVATCPNATRLTQILASIRTGDLGLPDAEKMAKTYELAGCYETALQIRATALATQSAGVLTKSPTAHLPGGIGGTGAGGPGTATGPFGADPFTMAAIPDASLRAAVQALWAKNPCLWTNADFDAYNGYMGTGGALGSILQSFVDSGAFVLGTNTIPQVTAMTDLSKQYMYAWKCRSSV